MRWWNLSSAPGGTPSNGLIVLVVDESQELAGRIAGGTKSKAECLATAVNSCLAQWTALPGLDVALVGYRGDGQEGAIVGCRWAGPLAGCRIVRSEQMAAAPLTVEIRTRRVPAPGGFREEAVPFPIWYVPTLGPVVFAGIGFGYCHHLINSWVAATACRKPPLVLSFVEASMPHSPQLAVEKVLSVRTPAGPPLVLHAHFGGAAASRPVLYPSADTFLPCEVSRGLFACSSTLPDYMLVALRRAQVPVNAEARGLIFNATMTDMIRFLALGKAYAQADAELSIPRGSRGKKKLRRGKRGKKKRRNGKRRKKKLGNASRGKKKLGNRNGGTQKLRTRKRYPLPVRNRRSLRPQFRNSRPRRRRPWWSCWSTARLPTRPTRPRLRPGANCRTTPTTC